MTKTAAFVFMSSLLIAGQAHARFGKGSSGSSRPSSGSSSSGRTTPPQSHSASPVPRSSFVPGRYSFYGPPAGYYYGGWGAPRWRNFGYGYGYSYWYRPPYLVQPAPQTYQEPAQIRVTLGVEGQGYIGGATLGAHLTFEGERWGAAFSGGDIIVRADDGTNAFDHIGSFTAHVTFAFLAGQYGRLRAELGADSFFAPSAVFLGPTGGLSGVLWFGGPVGIDGAILVTPWPFQQIDAKAGLVVGLGSWGLRAGWRVQALNDRGVVDGVVHSDIFNGPYAGVSYVF